jgi:hypothetical protein
MEGTLFANSLQLDKIANALKYLQFDMADKAQKKELKDITNELAKYAKTLRVMSRIDESTTTTSGKTRRKQQDNKRKIMAIASEEKDSTKKGAVSK